jgi:uncharacterized protein
MSCVYEGIVRHRRHEPVQHEFSYRIALDLVDLAGEPADRARDLVEAHGHPRPAGPVRLLTQARGFNPVRFYYCYDADEHLQAVVAEVTNTPWGERHSYVLVGSEGSVEKAMHVSPFMGMDHSYRWRVTEPGERLIVHIDSLREGAKVFDATLTLRRRARALRSYPATTLARIYAQALRLKLKGAPYFPHPERSR